MIGEHWTPERVGRCLIAAMRAMPGAAIYSPRKAEIVPLHGAEIEGRQLLALTVAWFDRPEARQRFKDPIRVRLQLLTWARVMATEGQRWGTSISDRCQYFGWRRASFERNRVAALQQIADWLNGKAPSPIAAKRGSGRAGQDGGGNKSR